MVGICKVYFARHDKLFCSKYLLRFVGEIK
jgi:hypothetical protein